MSLRVGKPAASSVNERGPCIRSRSTSVAHRPLIAASAAVEAVYEPDGLLVPTPGAPVQVEGTATDVARRGPDGCWRYVIDNALGTST
ncbi:hypothetical protein [Kutzneria chonburiensis]|uniref:Uncharacterized protein n=1 Tax=Kutzneria chonburiensis TaxID=1483604 RepID=A0ABV6MMC6_9PSEU|nr:hypothetical protein [Kutzneria chonburiensis]